MSKRGSGAPRHPRNPVAKAVRTPAFKQRVVPDKRRLNTLKAIKQGEAGVEAEEKADAAELDKD